jgi:hypothetical protein
VLDVLSLASRVKVASRNGDALTEARARTRQQAGRPSPAFSPSALPYGRAFHHPCPKVRLDSHGQGQLRPLAIRAAVGGALVPSVIDGAGAELVRSVGEALVIQVGGEVPAYNLGRKRQPRLRATAPDLDLTARDA